VFSLAEPPHPGPRHPPRGMGLHAHQPRHQDHHLTPRRAPRHPHPRRRRAGQWQLDVSSAGRVWYVIDTTTHTVWVTLATAGHPGATATDTGKGTSRTR